MKSPIIKSAQAEGKFTILFDSGIRTGSDVIKALALGAQGVLRTSIFFLYSGTLYSCPICLIMIVGRPYVYGLALGGEDGVASVVHSLLCDLEATLGLAGYSSIAEIQGKGEEIIRREL